MINRPNYIEAINPFIDQPLVKILAGIRRCGKSTIFEMLEEELLRRGVPADHIICKRYTEMDIPENITAIPTIFQPVWHFTRLRLFCFSRVKSLFFIPVFPTKISFASFLNSRLFFNSGRS